jgi:diamine N-acetyltransferase
MHIKTKNSKPVYLRKLCASDFDSLITYLEQLSNDTKKRFGPHPFDRASVVDFYEQNNLHIGYIGIDMETSDIIAYCIIKMGYLEHDQDRLSSYGLSLQHQTDCTFAPSVADTWQGQGVGNHLFRLICADLISMGFKRMILWGGVQTSNEQALHYYSKLGFKNLGRFFYNGENDDMILNLH